MNRCVRTLVLPVLALFTASGWAATVYPIDNFEGDASYVANNQPLATGPATTPWLKLGSAANLMATDVSPLSGSYSAQTTMNLAANGNGSIRKNLGSAGVDLSAYLGGTATVVAKETSGTLGNLSLQFSIAGTPLADGTTIPSYFSTTAQTISTSPGTYTFVLDATKFTTGTGGRNFAGVLGTTMQLGLRITGTSGVASTNTLVIDDFKLTAAPEPTSLAMAGVIAGGLVLRRRRNR